MKRFSSFTEEDFQERYNEALSGQKSYGGTE